MSERLLQLVIQALCRETFYEDFEYREHGDYSYFIAVERDIRHGAYRIAKSWFTSKDMASISYGVMLLANSPLIPMREVDVIFAPPLPFDE